MSLRARATLVFSLGMCLLLEVPAWPDEPSAALKARVKQLVEQLGDLDERKQEAAGADLFKLGPDILPLLPGPGAKLKQPQARHLAALAKTLRDVQARKDLAPKLVNLQSGAISLGKALEELAKQTGVTVEDRRRQKDAVNLKLNLKQATFWQAVDAIAREADARVYPYRDRVALVDGPNHELPTSYHGIFRMTVKRIAAVRDLETDAHFYLATLEVAWEPRFKPFLLDTRPQALVVKDDKDRSLPVVEEGGGKAPVESPIAMTIDLRLPAPPRAAARLNLVQGSLLVVGPSKMVEFTFDTLDRLEKDAAAREQSRDGVTVRLGKPALGKVWSLEVTMELPPDGPEFESFQSWLVNNKIYLQNVKTDQRFCNNGGYATDQVLKNKASLTYHFIEEKKLPRGKPGDWKVVYRTPGAIVELPVPFEFKDLLLP